MNPSNAVDPPMATVGRQPDPPMDANGFQLVAEAGADFLQVLWTSDVSPERLKNFPHLPRRFLAVLIAAGLQALATALCAPAAIIAASAKPYMQQAMVAPSSAAPCAATAEPVTTSTAATATAAPVTDAPRSNNSARQDAMTARCSVSAVASTSASAATALEASSSGTNCSGKKRANQQTDDRSESADGMRRFSEEWDGKTHSHATDFGKNNLFAAMKTAFRESGFAVNRSNQLPAESDKSHIYFVCSKSSAALKTRSSNSPASRFSQSEESSVPCEFRGRIVQGLNLEWTVRIDRATHNHLPAIGTPPGNCPRLSWTATDRRIMAEHLLVFGLFDLDELHGKLHNRRRSDGVLLMPNRTSVGSCLSKKLRRTEGKSPEEFKAWVVSQGDGEPLPDENLASVSVANEIFSISSDSESNDSKNQST